MMAVQLTTFSNSSRNTCCAIDCHVSYSHADDVICDIAFTLILLPLGTLLHFCYDQLQGQSRRLSPVHHGRQEGPSMLSWLTCSSTQQPGILHSGHAQHQSSSSNAICQRRLSCPHHFQLAAMSLLFTPLSVPAVFSASDAGLPD